jgi:hypothetical protein
MCNSDNMRTRRRSRLVLHLPSHSDAIWARGATDGDWLVTRAMFRQHFVGRLARTLWPDLAAVPWVECSGCTQPQTPTGRHRRRRLATGLIRPNAQRGRWLAYEHPAPDDASSRNGALSQELPSGVSHGGKSILPRITEAYRTFTPYW